MLGMRRLRIVGIWAIIILFCKTRIIIISSSSGTISVIIRRGSGIRRRVMRGLIKKKGVSFTRFYTVLIINYLRVVGGSTFLSFFFITIFFCRWVSVTHFNIK
jgi:hypothetical protein